jgi:hypothetical protein
MVKVLNGGSEGAESRYLTVSYSPARSIKLGAEEEEVEGNLVRWGTLFVPFYEPRAGSQIDAAGQKR